jgi:membrane dipeptidase
LRKPIPSVGLVALAMEKKATWSLGMDSIGLFAGFLNSFPNSPPLLRRNDKTMISTQPAGPPRFIDLRIDWLAQYAPETKLFGPESNARASRDLARIEGYLGATSAAFLMLGRDREDWARRPDSWAALGDLIARSEAEFPGRVLRSGEDYSRWQSEPDHLTWIVLGIGGFESLIASKADLNRLPMLFERGVRVFQPFSTAAASEAVLLENNDLLISFLETLESLNPDSAGPRPILDLAGMEDCTTNEALSWLEAKEPHARRVLITKSSGPMEAETTVRLRRLGGFTVLSASSSSFDSLASLRFAIESVASISLDGETGYTGIGLATDAFGDGNGLASVVTVADLVSWTVKVWGSSAATALLRDNATAWIARIVGAS